MKLAGMTASVASSAAATRVGNLFRDREGREESLSELYSKNGEVIAETLGQLKGAVMKVGQIASQARDMLPPEMADALTSLQKEAPPMPYEVIAQQIESELGSPPELLFDAFDEEPFAAASIGQVHRARTDDGREVVVKVQYPGVEESCDSDLAQLKLAMRAASVVRIPRKAMNAVFEELRARIHEELDYCLEADSVREFRALHSNDPNIVVPDVVGERSAQRVLTLTYEYGDHLDELDDNPAYTPEVRSLLGQRIFDAMSRELFEHQAFHGDPHPGNFAFRPDTTLVIYDYGCVKRLKPGVLAAYCDVIRTGIAEDYDAVDRALIRLGARKPEKTDFDVSYYKRWRDIFIAPFLGEDFDFGTSTLHDQFARLTPGFMKHLPYFQPPAESVFIDRMIGGHYWNMRSLGVVANFMPLVQQYLDAEMAGRQDDSSQETP